jgi:hypothetical protein
MTQRRISILAVVNHISMMKGVHGDCLYRNGREVRSEERLGQILACGQAMRALYQIGTHSRVRDGITKKNITIYNVQSIMRYIKPTPRIGFAASLLIT